ncbi:MAG: preprotein translocase subunit YajC [Clostridia bacterium]|nr:preprotein translocase subunit YajC [Clostridia bacterium]
MNILLLASSGLPLLIIMLVLIVGMFVFSSISNKKKQKEAQEKVNSLKIGDRVKTIGGICGFVAEINDNENTFVLETGKEGKKCFIKFDKGAIYQTAPAQGNAVVAPKEEAKPEEKKEEIKEQPVEEVKAEVKEEVKAEVKEEVKEEPKAE